MATVNKISDGSTTQNLNDARISIGGGAGNPWPGITGDIYLQTDGGQPPTIQKSGGWTYCVYPEGYAECGGKFEFSCNVNKYGNNMYAGDVGRPASGNYPVTFIEMPTVTLDFDDTGGTDFGLFTYDHSTTQAPAISCGRCTSASVSGTVFFHVIGRWFA